MINLLLQISEDPVHCTGSFLLRGRGSESICLYRNKCRTGRDKCNWVCFFIRYGTMESMRTVLIDSEYAGTTIDADTVEFWCGRDLVTEMVPKGDTVDSIFMRGN